MRFAQLFCDKSRPATSHCEDDIGFNLSNYSLDVYTDQYELCRAPVHVSLVAMLLAVHIFDSIIRRCYM